MNREDVMRMAQEAGGCTPEWDDFWEFHQDALERFAALVAAAEREACAKVAEEQADSPALTSIEQYRAKFIADAIRARLGATEMSDIVIGETDMSDVIINRRIAITSVVDTTRRIFGTTDAFSSMLTDVSRKFRYFVIEEVNGNVQMKFTNTNPEQPR